MTITSDVKDLDSLRRAFTAALRGGRLTRVELVARVEVVWPELELSLNLAGTAILEGLNEGVWGLDDDCKLYLPEEVPCAAEKGDVRRDREVELPAVPERIQKLQPGVVWHQHPRGGGWVSATARVSDRATVGPNAIIYGQVLIYGTSVVMGVVTVCGDGCIKPGRRPES